MFCRYSDNNRHPLYVLGPVKQEDEWDRPRIIRYHDILSNSEIEKVKELAKPRVSSRSTLRGSQGLGCGKGCKIPVIFPVFPKNSKIFQNSHLEDSFGKVSGIFQP
jgi:hypothetical protein